MPAPPEVAELDEDIERVGHEIKKILLLRRTLALSIPPLLGLLIFLILLVPIFKDGSLFGFTLYGGIGVLIAGGVAIGRRLEADDELFRLRNQEKRLIWDRRELLSGRAPSRVRLHARYKEHLSDLIDDLRLRSRRYKRMYNLLQVIVIVGSISASTLTGVLGPIAWARWSAVIVTLGVGVSAGLSAFFKLRERSTSLQQCAEEMAQNYCAVELRIGEYSELRDEEALRKFVANIERLRAQQSERDIQLDQAPDLTNWIRLDAGEFRRS